MMPVAHHPCTSLRRLVTCKLSEEGPKFSLNRRLEQLTRALAQHFPEGIRHGVSTRKLDNGSLDNGSIVHGGASSSVGWLCRNDNPTR